MLWVSQFSSPHLHVEHERSHWLLIRDIFFRLSRSFASTLDGGLSAPTPISYNSPIFLKFLKLDLILFIDLLLQISPVFFRKLFVFGSNLG